MNELALFAGAGGGILGGKLLGWRCVCAVEIDDYARRVLMARQDDGCLEPFPIWDDIYEANGFTTQDVCVYYRRGARAALHSMVLRFLPRRVVEKIRAHFRQNQTAKDFLMKDKRSDVVTVPAFGNQWRRVPVTASLQYVGKKLRRCESWVWPNQECYPKR